MGRFCMALAQGRELGFQHFVMLLQISNFIDEHRETVIEPLHLLLLVGADDFELIIKRGALGEVEAVQSQG